VILRDVLGAAAGATSDVDVQTDPDGGLVWSRAGRPFAKLTGDGTAAEFALDPAVASAAARTPDVEVSGRGPGWVRFSPAALDAHGVDRATAWFASAHRRVSGG